MEKVGHVLYGLHCGSEKVGLHQWDYQTTCGGIFGIRGLVDNSIIVGLMDYEYNRAEFVIDNILHGECEGFVRRYQRMIFYR